MHNKKQDDNGAAMLVFFIVCCVGSWAFGQMDLSVVAHNLSIILGY